MMEFAILQQIYYVNLKRNLRFIKANANYGFFFFCGGGFFLNDLCYSVHISERALRKSRPRDKTVRI